MTTPRDSAPEDDYWRRPADPAGVGGRPAPDSEERPPPPGNPPGTERAQGAGGTPGIGNPPGIGSPPSTASAPATDDRPDVGASPRVDSPPPPDSRGAAAPSPWAAPAGVPGRPVTGPGPAGTGGGYAGPPPTTPPPAGWRTPVHLQPAPPRTLPPQDMTALDAAEQRAQRLTWTVGAVAGAVLLGLFCLLCSRVLF